jgi:predicted alpha/beta hydrolase
MVDPPRSFPRGSLPVLLHQPRILPNRMKVYPLHTIAGHLLSMMVVRDELGSVLVVDLILPSLMYREWWWRCRVYLDDPLCYPAGPGSKGYPRVRITGRSKNEHDDTHSPAPFYYPCLLCPILYTPWHTSLLSLV